MADLQAIIDDLRAEGDELDALVSDLSRDGWAASTPAAGWTIAHQVAHLSWTDMVADMTSRAASGDSAGADEFAQVMDAAAKDPMSFVDDAAHTAAAQSPDELVREWRTRRAALADSLGRVPAGVKIAWFGPPMSTASLASARLMETWAHGQDIADALGIVRLPTDRLRNIAHMGVRTRNFAYMINGMTPPVDEFRVELTSPGGELWSWGPEDAEQRVSGNAQQFCLLVAQRAHRADLALDAVGNDADRWLDIAQVFAGPPGGGRDRKSDEAHSL